MRTLYTFQQKTTKLSLVLLLILSLFAGSIAPAQAATLDELAKALNELQVLVNQIKNGQKPSVLAATITTVSTGAELTTALNAATGGETILLNAGNYGVVSIRNKAYTAAVTLKSANVSNMASIRELSINNTSKVTLENIKLDYVFAAGDPEFATPFAVEYSSDITLSNLMFDGDMVSGRNAIDNGYANGRGLQISDSTRVTLQNSEITRFLRGLILYTSTDIKILNNNINLIRSDGINVVESTKVTIEGNNIHDFRCAPNSEDHADMIQFFTTGTTKPTTDIIIRNNTLNVGQGSWTQSLFMRNEVVDQGQAGSAMFYKNFLIEGNTISNAHTHGITLGEVAGAVIRNNTINAASLNLNDPHNASYIATYGATAGITVPKLSVSAASTNVTLSGNAFTGGAYYTGTRIDPAIPPASWSVTTTPTPTPAPSTAPTLTLSASPTSVTAGGASTLSWSSTNTTACTASGAWTGSKSTSGTQSTGALSSTPNYTLTCTGTGGSVSKSASVGVTSEPLPPVSGGAVVSVANATQLLAALKSVTVGGAIELASGNYGSVTISGADKSARTYIKPAAGATPIFTELNVNSDFWDVSGIEVRPTTAIDAVEIGGDNVTFKNNTVTYGNRSGWSASQWLSKVADGITFSGTNTLITGNKVINVRYGIQGMETATGGVVENNTIDGFTGDGMRGLGNNMTFRGNLVKNAYSVDDTHQDGFQSWSLGNGSVGAGVVKGNTIKGNTFINTETPDAPLAGEMQGIGLFDGMYEDWVIEDNVVIVNHWHGISVYGARNVIIRNNTVIDPNVTTPGPAWIQIVNHKNGTAPVNSRIEKNLANTVKTNVGVTVTDNKTVAFAQYDSHFVDWQNEDLRLKSTAPSGAGYGARIGSVTTPTPTPVPVPTPTPTPTPTPIITTFKVGDRVSVVNNVNVRTIGQVSATTLIGVNPLGSVGTLTTGPTQSTESFGTVVWFNVNFDTGFDGWVGADNYSLIAPAPVPVPTPTPIPTGVDTDADSIIDTLDNCPTKKNTTQLNFDKDAQGDACDTDDDNDGIRDTSEITGCRLNPSTTCPSITPTPTPNVTTTDNLRVRAAAGGAILGTQPLGAAGISDMTTQVTIAGTTWIYVNFTTGFDGYVSSAYLTGIGAGSASQDLVQQLLAQLAVLQAALAALLAQ